jgi:hypothetical protein
VCSEQERQLKFTGKKLHKKMRDGAGALSRSSLNANLLRMSLNGFLNSTKKQI